MSRSDIHTISLFVANKPGVLLRIALIFSRRGFNIESLVVSSALDGRFSRMTITAKGDPKTLEQIIKQANKLIDVLHATDHIDEDCIEQELAMIKVKTCDNRSEVLQIVRHFKAETVDLSEESLVIQSTGRSDKIDAMIDMLKKFEILEIVRSGKMAMKRGVDLT